MSNLKTTGKITNILEPQLGEGSNGAWAKRVFVLIEEGEMYPNVFVFSLFKSGEHLGYATDKFTYVVGDLVEVEYNVRANEYQGKWYGDNSVWKITKVGSTENESQQIPDNLGNDDNELRF